jgi:hypothetical protein
MKVKVKKDVWLREGGHTYNPGEEFEVTEQRAAQLSAVAEPVGVPAPSVEVRTEEMPAPVADRAMKKGRRKLGTHTA